MVDRHDRQVLARHGRDQPPPKPGADDDFVGHDGAARSLDTLDVAVLDDEVRRRGIGKGPQLAGLFGLIDQLARYDLRARHHQPGVRVPHAALHQALLR